MRTLALFLIGLVFGGGIGFTVAAGMGVTFDGHDHGDPAHHDLPHYPGIGAVWGAIAHGNPVEVEPTVAPKLSLSVTPDPHSGFNLHVMVENFEFSPEQASLAHSAGQGHAHVYVNGHKQGRLYGPWAHLAELPKGDVTIRVSLNSNDHRPILVNGSLIIAETKLVVE